VIRNGMIDIIWKYEALAYAYIKNQKKNPKCKDIFDVEIHEVHEN
jgi:hypothetical protein